MDCKTARLLLLFARPRPTELEASEADALRHHLADCPDCSPLARAERQADERLAQAVQAVPVPEGLRDRLVTRLQAERRGWYRRRVASSLAMAAAVLVAVTLGVSLLAGPRETIDAERLCDNAVAMRGAPPEYVERWFADRGVSVQVPREFNYALLTSCGLEQLQNTRRVPRLLFQRGTAEVWVYILSSKQFNLEASMGQQFASGGYTVEVLKHPENPDVAYLVLYTGGPLTWFRAPPAQEAG